jgi:hypothetical protein
MVLGASPLRRRVPNTDRTGTKRAQPAELAPEPVVHGLRRSLIRCPLQPSTALQQDVACCDVVQRVATQRRVATGCAVRHADARHRALHGRALHAARCMLHVAYCLLHVACMLCVAWGMACVACGMLRAACGVLHALQQYATCNMRHTPCTMRRNACDMQRCNLRCNVGQWVCWCRDDPPVPAACDRERRLALPLRWQLPRGLCAAQHAAPACAAQHARNIRQ